MDMLDPLETSSEEDIVGKVIINKNLHLVDEQDMDSDEEQKVVEHLSPQTLLETSPDNEVQYSFKSPEGTITYRVLQVDEANDNVSQIVSTNSSFTGSQVPQVLTGNLNGQLYVIGNPNEVFNSQGGSRTLAPRAHFVDTTPAVAASLKKRDEKRRATHNEVERRRRDKINNWITKLSKIMPETPSDLRGSGGGHHESQSKGGILAKACEYIMDLKESGKKLDVCLKENKQLSQNLEIMRQQNEALEAENAALRDILERSGLEIPKVEIITST